ncbi:putative xyloglucan galactosyltransferase GT14 [Heracleum sosnowskyi]|uniref:Xyloglucan galactosyltransferase GT14 n=1 Tax=Heracleum sosnowskyi TaxID=360622 RepID=A0AAD8H8W9_9APIA|nr:putative xyloglucan galactosyltransferase GT14 [Heracleum sosnowskyi]
MLAKFCKKPPWFVLLTLCVLAYLSHRSSLSYFTIPLNSRIAEGVDTEQSSRHDFDTKGVDTDQSSGYDFDAKGVDTDQSSRHDFDACFGRYIYVHDLPSKFNVDILKNCSYTTKWYSKICGYMSNFGLGPRTKDSGKVLQKRSWYATNQFMLEVIFHNRMKKYKCLTNDSALATAIFVPFYAGLDVGRYLWDDAGFYRDANSIELMKWLTEKTEWKRLQGRDHFFIAGRITWDFRRRTDIQSDWGNKLMLLPEAKNMTILGIESSPWTNNEFAIPYPTYFHPTRDLEVFGWQSKIKRTKRPYLYSFVGAPRPKSEDSIRSIIIKQCIASRRKCKFLDCNGKNCQNPVNVMSILQRSNFCLQPSGDSHTRRSIFDSILAGCIPVFFHPGSAFVQYIWYFPKNYTKYSVFIPEKTLRDDTKSIETILRAISNSQVRSMREEVIRLIPRITYADPQSNLETLEDAFDTALRGVIKRVDIIKKVTEDRTNDSVEFLEDKQMIVKQWDSFFRQ